MLASQSYQRIDLVKTGISAWALGTTSMELAKVLMLITS